MVKQALVYEGKVKKVFTTEDKEFFIQEFNDSGPGVGIINGKGACNNRISAACFEMLEKNGIATHYVKIEGDRDMAVRRLDFMPVEVVCHNAVAGDLCKRLNLPEGDVLPLCIVEFFLRHEALDSPSANKELFRLIPEVTEGDVALLRVKALEVNAMLKPFFEERGLVNAELKLEFGRDSKGEMRLAGEITPDTCRLWDRTTHEKLDKDKFRRDLSGSSEAYIEVLRRVAGRTA